jgi:hypothetical protein
MTYPLTFADLFSMDVPEQLHEVVEGEELDQRQRCQCAVAGTVAGWRPRWVGPYGGLGASPTVAHHAIGVTCRAFTPGHGLT